jgi:hypothetical protein
MAKPVATPDQIAAIESTVQDQQTQQAAFTETAGLQDAVIEKATKVDDAFKALFDWYNDAIIGKYDAEKKAINGVFITSPVVEADIIAVGANPPSGRLVPTPPAVSIVRIPEFDGGGTSIAADYEQKHILDQAAVEDVLQNGYPAASFNPTTETDSALTGVSTTLDITDSAMAVGLAPNDIVVVEGITEIAVIKILTITPAVGTPPPYDYTADIEVLVPPTGSIAAGATFANFTGFTNAERTTKTATDALYQDFLDYLVTSLEAEINKRLLRLAEQIAALGANEDPDGVANIGSATTAATNNQTFLNNYLVSTDISDTGLTSLSGDRSSRSAFLTTRLGQINAAYTGQTENYYDQRYTTADNRGNVQRGTLRAKSNAQGVKGTMLGLAASLTGSINALNGILPP